MSRSGETRLGLTDRQSAQTHPLECSLHYDDDDSYDCNDDNGHPQKNSPTYVRKEVLVGRMFIRFEAPERPSGAILRHQIGPSTAANDFHGWTMCSWLWKFDSDGFCPFEKANPAAGSRMVPR